MSLSIPIQLTIFLAASITAESPQIDLDARPVIVSIPSPAGEKSRLPNLTSGADGQLYLSWVEPGKDGSTRLLFSTFSEDAWSEAKEIAAGSDWFVNWADFPSLAVLSDGTIAAHWLARLGTGTYAYGVQVSLSTDGGVTWSDPIVPHSDRSPSEHGFVSMVPRDSDHFTLVWLDGREMMGGHGHGLDAEAGGDMTIRTNTLHRSGKLGTEKRLDQRACECCSTSAVVYQDRVLVAYRDRSDDEVRDISIVRFGETGSSSPRNVHRDNWKNEGCPVNGPVVAKRGEELGVLWYTEGDQRSRVLFASSTDGAMSFSKPIAVDDGNPVGRVDLAPHPQEGWLACWLERGDEGGEIRVRAIDADGVGGASLLVARTSSERIAGFPHIAQVGGRVWIAWTEVTEGEAGAQAAVTVRSAELVYPSKDGQKPTDSKL